MKLDDFVELLAGACGKFRKGFGVGGEHGGRAFALEHVDKVGGAKAGSQCKERPGVDSGVDDVLSGAAFRWAWSGAEEMAAKLRMMAMDLNIGFMMFLLAWLI